MRLSGDALLLVMADLVIRKKNEVFLRVDCDPHIKHELQDQLVGTRGVAM